jgi:hypothetical protein
MKPLIVFFMLFVFVSCHEKKIWMRNSTATKWALCNGDTVYYKGDTLFCLGDTILVSDTPRINIIPDTGWVIPMRKVGATIVTEKLRLNKSGNKPAKGIGNPIIGVGGGTGLIGVPASSSDSGFFITGQTTTATPFHPMRIDSVWNAWGIFPFMCRQQDAVPNKKDSFIMHGILIINDSLFVRGFVNYSGEYYWDTVSVCPIIQKKEIKQ